MSTLSLERAHALNAAMISLSLETTGIGSTPQDKITLLKETATRRVGLEPSGISQTSANKWHGR